MRLFKIGDLSSPVLHTPRAGRMLPAGEEGCAAGLLSPSHHPKQTWTCSAVQVVTRVPLSLYLGPRLVNVVSLALKILTANHVLIMQ